MSTQPPESLDEWIALGFEKGYLKQDNGRYVYLAAGKAYKASDPEERVRAAFYVELIERYKYPPHRIDLEVKPPRREPKIPSDIIVFQDDERKQAFAVVECKRDDASAADIETGLREVLGNSNLHGAAFGMLVAGNVRIVFDPKKFDLKTRKGEEGDLPVRYGKPPEYRYYKDTSGYDLTPTTQKDLENKLQQCHDILWEGGRLNPIEAFDEMSKLMLAKMMDERVRTKRNESYGFQCGRNESTTEIARRVRSIYTQARANAPSVFRADIAVSDMQIRRIIEILQGISLNRTDPDAKGKAFEQFMNGKVFRGDMGQYFTDRHIVDFVVEMLEPSERDRIIDPACGSGGFLLAALEKVRHNLIEGLGETEGRDVWKDWARQNLHGIEINQQISRVAMMDMIIHGDGHTNIKCADALETYDALNNLKDGIMIKQASYTLVMTNPPFGAVVSPSQRGNGSNYFHLYELGGKDNKRKSQKMEILFIERCLDLLEPDGRMGIVLPDGVLTNSSLQFVRDFIMERAQILAVVSLPQHAFVPYGSTVKSSLLFLRKWGEGEKPQEDYPIFMAIAEHIGYDSTLYPDSNDLPAIAQAYHNFKRGRRDWGIQRSFGFQESRAHMAYRFDPKYFLALPLVPRGANLKRFGEVASRRIEPIDRTAATSFRLITIHFDGSIVLRDLKREIKPTTPLFYAYHGDLVSSKIDVRNGAIGVIPDELGTAAVTSEYPVYVPDPTQVRPRFLHLVFRTQWMQDYLKGLASGHSGRKRIAPADFEDILVPVPPLDEQDRIIARIEEAENRLRSAEAELERVTKEVKEWISQIVEGE